jgi:hypothetical protein
MPEDFSFAVSFKFSWAITTLARGRHSRGKPRDDFSPATGLVEKREACRLSINRRLTIIHGLDLEIGAITWPQTFRLRLLFGRSENDEVLT